MNCKSCPTRVSWESKFKCPSCLSCPSCPSCPSWPANKWKAFLNKKIVEQLWLVESSFSSLNRNWAMQLNTTPCRILGNERLELGICLRKHKEDFHQKVPQNRCLPNKQPASQLESIDSKECTFKTFHHSKLFISFVLENQNNKQSKSVIAESFWICFFVVQGFFWSLHIPWPWPGRQDDWKFGGEKKRSISQIKDEWFWDCYHHHM